MGSSGQKPRKQHQRQHLPKVGSRENVDYEVSQRRREVFHGWPWIVVAVVLLIVFLAFIAIT